MKYTAQEKQEMVKKFPYWHYQFDLGDGIVTQPSIHNIEKWHECRKNFILGTIRYLFGDSLEGIRCLDVACNAGFWSFELAKMQAEYVLAVDKAKYVIEQAIFVRDCIQEEHEFNQIDFKNLDIFDINEEIGNFDLMLVLGIAYHLTDPVGFFKKMYSLSKRLMIIDSVVSTRDEPILELSDHTKFSGCCQDEFSFVPTIKSLTRILQHVGFKYVMKVLPTPDLLELYQKEERVLLIVFK